MAALTVLKWFTADGVEQMLLLLQDLQQQQVINIQAAASVVWPHGARKPKTKQLPQLEYALQGALDNTFWGLLFGLIFFVPPLELTTDTSSVSLAGQFANYGIGEDFIKLIRDKVTEGTAAVFLISSDDTMDRIVDAGMSMTFEIITIHLSKVKGERLRETFAGRDE